MTTGGEERWGRLYDAHEQSWLANYADKGTWRGNSIPRWNWDPDELEWMLVHQRMKLSWPLLSKVKVFREDGD